MTHETGPSRVLADSDEVQCTAFELRNLRLSLCYKALVTLFQQRLPLPIGFYGWTAL